MPDDSDPPLGYEDIAARLGVTAAFLRGYKSAGRMPKPDVDIPRKPLWRWSTIEPWWNGLPGKGWRAGRGRTADHDA